MSTTTTRNALVKPDYTDAADIAVLNTDLDTIDAAIAKGNYAASAAPTVNDDTGDGYVAGSIWLDTTNHDVYMCENPAAGAAVWKKVNSAASGVLNKFDATTAPTANDDSGDGYAVGSLWLDITNNQLYQAKVVTVGAAVWLLFGVHHYSTTTGPGVGDDIADGFAIGSVWTDTTAHKVYMCESASAGAAVWNQIYPSAGTGDLKADGTVPLTANWDVGAYKITANQLESDVATGTAPLVVASTTQVANLNCASLNGVADTGFVKQSLADAKGDIIAASANDTWARTAVGSNTDVLQANSAAANGISWGPQPFWLLMPGAPTRTANTTFTLTDASNANYYDRKFGRTTVVKWTEDATVKLAMVVNSSYGADTVTITIAGDAMAKIDAGSCKYLIYPAESQTFIIPGTLAATTDAAKTWYVPSKNIFPLCCDAYVKTAGTTNATEFDINDDGSSIFGGTAASIASTATSDTGNAAAAPTTSVAGGSLVTVDINSVSTTAPIEAYIYFFYINDVFGFR